MEFLHPAVHAGDGLIDWSGAQDPAAPDRAVRDRLPDPGRRAADDRLPAGSQQPAHPPQPAGAVAATRSQGPRAGLRPGSPRSGAEGSPRAPAPDPQRCSAPAAVRVPGGARGDDPAVRRGRLAAGRTSAPLRAITATARRVSSENLGERIALSGPADELRELADTFDGMLGRLDGAFASQRHFVANASHELRTPLAIMRTELDVALADPAAQVAELRQMGEAVRDTVDRCERLIAGLLMLARSQAAAGRDEPVDIAALAGDCITDLSVRAREARVDPRRPRAGLDRRRPDTARADGRQPDRQRDPPQLTRRLPGGQHARGRRTGGAPGGQRGR